MPFKKQGLLPERARDMLIHLQKMGSHAYGLAVPGSDTDLRGVYVPRDEALTPLVSVGPVKDPAYEDALYYPLDFFLDRLFAGRSEPLEMLAGMAETASAVLHPCLRPLVDAAPLFLTCQAARAYQGQARQLATKLDGSHWAQTADVPAPRLVDYLRPVWSTEEVLTRKALNGRLYLDARVFQADHTLVSRGGDIYLIVSTPGKRMATAHGKPIRRDVSLPSVPEAIVHADRESYLQHKQRYREWHQWHKQGRQMPQGYDPKTLMHALRAARMAREIAQEGRLRLFRPDAEELRAIRLNQIGRRDAEMLLQEAMSSLDAVIESSPLAPAVDPDKAMGVFREVVRLSVGAPPALGAEPVPAL